MYPLILVALNKLSSNFFLSFSVIGPTEIIRKASGPCQLAFMKDNNSNNSNSNYSTKLNNRTNVRNLPLKQPFACCFIRLAKETPEN